MKGRRKILYDLLVKNEAWKWLSFIFFVKLRKDWNFPLFLLQSFMYRNECKKLDIYFIYDWRTLICVIFLK